MNETRAVIVSLGVVILVALWIVWDRSEKVPSELSAQQTAAAGRDLNGGDGAKLAVSNLDLTGEVSTTRANATHAIASHPFGALFDAARRCHNLLWKRDDVAGSLAACERSDNSEDRADCSQKDNALRKKLAQIDHDLQAFSPVKAEIEHAYFAETKRSAIRGNADAQLCYLQARFNFSNGLPEIEEIDYKARMTDFVNAGISRGDWRVIELMGQPAASFHRKGPFLRRELTDGGPYVVYQMNRLLRLGAEGEYAQLLDARATAVTTDLTDEEIAKANKWAMTTFNQDFENSPRLTAPPGTCDSN